MGYSESLQTDSETCHGVYDISPPLASSFHPIPVHRRHLVSSRCCRWRNEIYCPVKILERISTSVESNRRHSNRRTLLVLQHSLLIVIG